MRLVQLSATVTFLACVVACGGTPDAGPRPGRDRTPARQEPARPEPTVTKAKYDAIATGMSYREACDALGESGEELSRNDLAGTTTVMYGWKNPDGSNMNAMFQNDKLVQKAQFGLR